MNLRMGSHGFAMAKIVLLLIVTLVVYPSTSKAQNGCIIYYGGGAYDNVVYTSPAGTTASCNGYTVNVYNSSSSTPVTSTCPKNNPSPDNYRQCIVGSSCGVLLQNYITTCPLDEHGCLLFIAIGTLGCFSLRRQSSGLNSINPANQAV